MSSKRKAAFMAASNDGDALLSKRRKSSPRVESAESTTRVGLAFLDQLKSTRDKKNRLIVTEFQTLPDRKHLPEYYLRIGLPMALDTIQGKLERREYPTMTTLESDLRRMVSNAKSFNEKSSDLFSDAEKIRKIVVSFMTQNNPAYESENYQPFSTPVPIGWQEKVQAQMQTELQDLDAEGETDPDEVPEQPGSLSTSRALAPAVEEKAVFESNPRRESSTPAVQDAEGAGESFNGNTFQQAQEKIMTELINLENEDKQSISAPFINLPSRDLRDYHRLIKHPVSLKSAQKAVRGIKGKERPTGSTFLKSWQAFQDEISYIWRNAREYNEDGSEISMLAGKLELYFNRRLAEAKRVVAEPPRSPPSELPRAPTKVKLRMSARSPEPRKITIRFGGQKANSSAGVSIDNEALKRQQDLVKAGANGQGASNDNTTPRPGPRNPFGRVPSGSGSIQIPPLHTSPHDESRNATIEHPVATVNGVKDEVAPGQSPALGAVQLDRDLNRSSESSHSRNQLLCSMPPPSNVTPSLASHSSYPQAATTNNHGWNAHPPAVSFDPRWRQPGKDALIANLSLSTYPGLTTDKPFHLDMPPSPTMSHQSITINLPKIHNPLRLILTLANHPTHRPQKTFVTARMQKVLATPQRAETFDARKSMYEFRVIEGVNRVEVEVIAGQPRGAPKLGSGPEMEHEKFLIFINVAKN